MNKAKFIKNYQLIFAILLILFIPISLLIYTNFLLKKVSYNLDHEFRDKATLALNIASRDITKYWPDVDLMQDEILKIATTSPDIKVLDVITQKDGKFHIIASLSKKDIGKELETTDLAGIAWQEDFIAFKTNASSNSSIQKLKGDDFNSKRRYQMIMKTFVDRSGKKVGIVSAKISLAEIDDLNKELISKAWIFLFIIIVAILLIIATNFKLLKYVVGYQKLQEVDAMKDEFISIASHELRAPLTAIKGYISMVVDILKGDKKPTKSTKQVIDFSNSALASSERLGALVEDMLDVSRIEQGRMKFDLQEVKLIDIVDEVIDQFAIPAKDKGLSLELDEIDGDIKDVLVKVDVDKLKQVVINIVSNAVKYTVKGGIKIRFVLDKKKDCINLKVKDTGLGMSFEERKNLFQKFYRVQTEKTKKITGTGLGLWLSRQIMREMKGDIFVDSIKGEGSEFTIVIKNYRLN